MVTETITQGYKNTEIGIIPEDWGLKTILDCTDCLDNLRVPMNESQRMKMKGDIPYCGANGVLDYVNDYVIDDDIILMAEDGGYFDEYASRPIAYQMTGKCWVNNHAHILKAKDNYSQDFIFYSLVHKNILPYITSGTRAKLNRSEMNRIEILFPKSKEEQSAIAQVLSDTDSLIESLDKLIEKKKNIKQGAMQELLSGKKRLPGFSGDWEVKKLGDVVDFIKGTGLSKTKVSTDGKNKCILYGELFTTYNEVINKIVSKTDYNEGTLSKSGDILMPGSTTTIGIDLAVASALLEDNVYLGGDINVLRKKEDSFDSQFLANYLTHIQKHKISEVTQGTTIIHLYGKNLKNLSINIPKSKEEQSAIAQVLSDMDTDIEKLEQKRDKYKHLKIGMMQQLLTGSIRLKW